MDRLAWGESSTSAFSTVLSQDDVRGAEYCARPGMLIHVCITALLLHKSATAISPRYVLYLFGICTWFVLDLT